MFLSAQTKIATNSFKTRCLDSQRSVFRSKPWRDSWTIKLDGLPIDQHNIAQLCSTIGTAQQEPIICVVAISENVGMGDVRITDEDIKKACKMANAHDFIKKLSDGYSTVIGAGAIQLSGGQKQRVAIARVIVRKPQILLLDEATSALDTECERMVQAALDKASQGRTTHCIAHRLSTIRNASKIRVFDQGLIAESRTQTLSSSWGCQKDRNPEILLFEKTMSALNTESEKVVQEALDIVCIEMERPSKREPIRHSWLAMDCTIDWLSINLEYYRGILFQI